MCKWAEAMGAAAIHVGKAEDYAPALRRALDAEPVQRVIKIRRDYNAWVADETMEDYALRFTATSARRWSNFRVANTALGATILLDRGSRTLLKKTCLTVNRYGLATLCVGAGMGIATIIERV